MSKCLTSNRAMSMSDWIPLGISTPMTRSFPKASAQSASHNRAVLSTGDSQSLHCSRFHSSQKNCRIHSTQSFLTFSASNILISPRLQYLNLAASHGFQCGKVALRRYPGAAGRVNRNGILRKICLQDQCIRHPHKYLYTNR